MTRTRATPGFSLAASLAVLVAAPVSGQWPSDDANPTEFNLAMNAKMLCSGIWVQGRDPALHVAGDLRRFDHFGVGDDFTYEIDDERKAGDVVFSTLSTCTYRPVQR